LSIDEIGCSERYSINFRRSIKGHERKSIWRAPPSGIISVRVTKLGRFVRGLTTSAKPKGPSTRIPLNVPGKSNSVIPSPIMLPRAFVKDRRSHCRERVISVLSKVLGRRVIEIGQSKRKIRSLNLILFIVLWVPRI